MGTEDIRLNQTGSATWVVQPADLASALPTEPGERFPPVFATSRMIALMETAASRIIRPLLKEGELSAGVTVNVKHTAATPVGAKVRAEARFLGKEGKLYSFEVVAMDEGGEIGRGTHQRAIIQTSRLMEAAQHRKPSLSRSNS